MATAEFSATANTVEATAASSNFVGAALTNAAVIANANTHATAVETAVGVLVADGASPTQAHVNTMEAAWDTLQADIDALTTAATATPGDMTVYIGNVANIGDMNVLEQCWRKIRKVISGSSLLAVGSGTPRSP